MIKITNKKLLSLVLSLGISLTGCETIKNNNTDANISSLEQTEDEYDIQQYYLIFINGNLHLAYAQASKEDNYMAQETGYGISEFIDVNTKKCIAKINPAHELDENAVFTNEYGEYASRFAIILCQDIINQDKVDQQTFDYLSSGNDKLYKDIQENYFYNVVEYTDYQNQVCADDLGIYTFYNNKKNTYHLGYNANRIYNCNYIYDIEKHKIYKKPPEGNYNFVPISEYYPYDIINEKDAIVLKDDYIKMVTKEEQDDLKQKRLIK